MERTELESAETSHTAKKKIKKKKSEDFLASRRLSRKPTVASVSFICSMKAQTKDSRDHNRCIIAEGYGKALGYAVKCP